MQRAHSRRALQEDCQVSLNTVDNIDAFLADINAGRWEAVLPQVSHLRLPTSKLFDLYEEVVLEMIELRETDAARVMLRTMKVFRRLQQEDPERFLRLEKLCNPCAAAPRLRTPPRYTHSRTSFCCSHSPSRCL